MLMWTKVDRLEHKKAAKVMFVKTTKLRMLAPKMKVMRANPQ